MRLPRATVAALLGTAGCGIVEPPPPLPPSAQPPSGSSTRAGADVRFALRFRDGGSADATVSYLLPSGYRHEENVRVPWESPVLSFPSGAVLSVHATATTAAPDAVLLCVLTAVPPATGQWVGGGVASSRHSPPPGAPYAACATEYRLGAWPPPEDDPDTGNLLIRVG